MRRFVLILCCAFALVLGSACVVKVTSVPVGSVAKDGSVYLGWHLVSKRRADKDHFVVGKKHGKFSTIRLHVAKAPAAIRRVTVTFGNGEKFNAKVKPGFKRGQWSRWIKLPGNKRFIRKVTIVAVAARKKGRMPKIEVYGQR